MPAKAAAKRSSQAAELEDDPDAETVSVPKAKAAKPRKSVPTEPPEEPVEEPEDEPAVEAEETEEQKVRKKAALSKRRKKARLTGYRSLAKQAGYIEGSGDGDCINSLISVSEAKRLTRCVPSTPGAIGYSKNEFQKRMDLLKNSITSAAARETQANSDAVLRSIMNETVQRSVDAGKKTISPSMMYAVLRPYADKLELTGVSPPIGLVRYAQDEGLLDTSESDVKERAEEKKEAAQNKKMYNDYVEAEQKARDERKAKRAAAVAKAAQEVAAN